MPPGIAPLMIGDVVSSRRVSIFQHGAGEDRELFWNTEVQFAGPSIPILIDLDASSSFYTRHPVANPLDLNELARAALGFDVPAQWSIASYWSSRQAMEDSRRDDRAVGDRSQ